VATSRQNKPAAIARSRGFLSCRASARLLFTAKSEVEEGRAEHRVCVLLVNTYRDQNIRFPAYPLTCNRQARTGAELRAVVVALHEDDSERNTDEALA
jgi:hypothetical protein